MQLSDETVTTPEVKSWQGLHLLHFQGSSCSQKVRIFLAEKGIAWESHPVDLLRQAHTTPWFLGINPRGVVPVLVHDGVVHVESNDIMEYLDKLPSSMPPFFPQTSFERERIQASLALEDSLHMDLRTITMGFLVPYLLAKNHPRCWKPMKRAGRRTPSGTKKLPGGAPLPRTACGRIRLGPRPRPLLRPLRRLSSGYGGVPG